MPFKFDNKSKEVNYDLIIPKLNSNFSNDENYIFKKLNNLIISCLDNKFENRPSMNEIISYMLNKEM